MNELKANQIYINKELDRIIKKYSFEYSNIHLQPKKNTEKFLSSLFEDFRVDSKESQDGKNEEQDFDDKNEENIPMQQFEKYMPEQQTLETFLKQERDSIMQSMYIKKESKIRMLHSGGNAYHEVQEREFVIKTTIVEADAESEDDILFMHMFLDTTQIGQLEEAKAQNHYQRQMLANVSHEFRTPLNSIMASLELMRIQDYGINNRLVKIASSSCKILGMLVEDILDHAKIESGVFQINEDIFTMTQCIQEIQEVFILQASGKGLELIINIDDRLQNLSILSDKQRIKQVLMNLISNALKFTDRGSITIEVSEHRDVLEESKCYEESKFAEDDFLHWPNKESFSEFSENLQS